MLSAEPSLRPGLYRLPDEPVGPRVLIPGFRSATSVRGAFGWFSAGWIGRLAPGLAEYINRDDAGPIDFTVAPVLWSPERTAVESAFRASPEEATARVGRLFTDGRTDASALANHALDCLAWMIATGRMRLRIAEPTIDSNYHPKIWLFSDGTHQVLARGSGNATGRGIGAGVEHLDVDVTWIDHSRDRVRLGVGMLDDWSRGRSAGIARVMDLPEALERDIIRTAPDSAPDPDGYLRAVREDGNPAWAVDAATSLRQRFATPVSAVLPRLSVPSDLRWQEGPYSHQGEAVAAWEGGAEPERGTISMATGAGKTLTALICATRVQQRLGDAPFLVVVSGPSRPIIEQWLNEVHRFGVRAVAPSLEPSPNRALTTLLRGLTAGGTHVAVVTNHMLCDPPFQATVARKVQTAPTPIDTLFIADEAHGLGAPGFLAHKPQFFTRRLALSATPERQYDPDGTEEIFDFFGPAVFEFGLDRAIGFCLCPYNYYVHTSTIDDHELEAFFDLSQRIGRVAALDKNAETDANLRRLSIARRRIIETAAQKISLLGDVLKRRRPRSLRHVLVYATAKDPKQFDQIGNLLTSLQIRWAPVTQEETRDRKHLAQIFDTFKSGGYQVLLAKKVLDEGVDIPSIREAFIVASSTVEREWVQRRGRVLRRHPDKPWAVVHDFLALPPVEAVGAGGPTLKRIVESELGRAFSFATHAQNATGSSGTMGWLAQIRNTYWPTGAPSNILGRAGDRSIAPGTPEGALW